MLVSGQLQYKSVSRFNQYYNARHFRANQSPFNVKVNKATLKSKYIRIKTLERIQSSQQSEQSVPNEKQELTENQKIPSQTDSKSSEQVLSGMLGIEKEEPPKKSDAELEKEISKFARQTASTFAPRASGATNNPAYKGSWLYEVFFWQAWILMAVGGLLSFNIIFPSDKPDIARLLGMWSVWMFTIPSLRARECEPQEKDALNLLFLIVPIMNITLPLVWKSFPFVFTSDVVALIAVYVWKVYLPNQEQK